MTPYDAAMAGIIVAGMVWGAVRGVTWQLASLASLVLGYMVAHPLSSQLAPYFPGPAVEARALAMIAVYFATSGGVFVVAWLIRATLRRLKFESFDRHLGMILGGLEGALLGMVVTLFVVSLAPRTRGPIFASPAGKAVGWVMASVGPVLPDEARGILAPFLSDGTGSPQAVPADAPALASDPGPRVPTPDAVPAGPLHPAPRDDSARRTAGSLGDLLQEEEARLGKAVSDGAAQGIRQAVGGGGGRGDDGTVERR